MAYTTFKLRIKELTIDGIKPRTVTVKIYPLATNTTRLKVVKDTTGGTILSGHVVRRATAGEITAGVFDIDLPDPRDTTLSPTGFGYEITVQTNYFSTPSVVFGPDDITDVISGGVVLLEDVTPTDTAAFEAVTNYATAGDLATETTRATTAEGLKAPIASPTFTGTVAGVTKSMVGLGSVDNTADTAKPVSTAQTAAFLPKLNPQVAVTGNNTSLDITATADKATLKILRYNNVSGPSWATGAIINSQGAFHSNAWMVLSGHMPGSPNSEGIYYPLLAALSQANQSMLSIWSDVNSCAMEVRTNTNVVGNRIFDGLDSAGVNRFSIGPFGELRWGSSTYAAQSTEIYGAGTPGVLTLRRPDAASGDVVLQVNAITGAAKVVTQINGAEAFSINAGVASAYFLQGGACVFRTNKINAGASLAVGGTDDVSAILGSYNVAHVAKHVLLGRGMAGQTGDLLRLEDSASAVLSRFGKSGRFITKVGTAPALGDLVDGEMALSTDASGNLIVTSRVAGALKTATVTVA